MTGSMLYLLLYKAYQRDAVASKAFRGMCDVAHFTEEP